MHIGEYIKYKRISLGYTQQQLADTLSISKQAVNKWERCLSEPDIMTLPELGVVLKKSPHFLVDMIWRGSHKGELSYPVFFSLTDRDGEDYVLIHYEFDNFAAAADWVEKAKNGAAEDVIEALAKYYDYDPKRTFRVEIQEYDSSYFDDPDTVSLLIESFDITSAVADFHNRSQVKN